MSRQTPLPENTPAAPVYFVVQRNNGEWTPASKIMVVYNNELLAEEYAARAKLEHPQQHFGVMALRSEARTVRNPVEIVYVKEGA